jgi:hypothetical protein
MCAETDLCASRDTQHVAPTGPFVYLPTFVLSAPHIVRLVARILAVILIGSQIGSDVHLCAFSSWVIVRFNIGIFPCGKIARTWSGGVTGSSKTTRVIRASRRSKRGRGIGVWILLRRVHTSILPSIRATLHYTVRFDARHQSRQPRVDFLCEPALSGCGDLLEPHHFPGLQRTAFLTPYSATLVSDGGLVCHLACLHGAWYQSGEMGHSVAVLGSERMREI